MPQVVDLANQEFRPAFQHEVDVVDDLLQDFLPVCQSALVLLLVQLLAFPLHVSNIIQSRLQQSHLQRLFAFVDQRQAVHHVELVLNKVVRGRIQSQIHQRHHLLMTRLLLDALPLVHDLLENTDRLVVYQNLVHLFRERRVCKQNLDLLLQNLLSRRVEKQLMQPLQDILRCDPLVQV